MKVPLYILGFLLRCGPQHGYRLKKRLEEIADFANIKLPTIYYHLEKMQKQGLISATQEKDGNRPERWVYTLADKGCAAFQKMVEQALTTPYDGEFLLDAALYFSEALNPRQLIDALGDHAGRLERELEDIEIHKIEALKHLAGMPKLMAHAIFSHHVSHLQAELNWVQETIGELCDHMQQDTIEEDEKDA